MSVLLKTSQIKLVLRRRNLCNISTTFPQSNSQMHHSLAEGGDKSRRWEMRSVSVTECWNSPRCCSLSRSRNEKHRCIYLGNQWLRPQLQLPEDPWNTGRWSTQLSRQVWRNFFYFFFLCLFLSFFFWLKMLIKTTYLLQGCKKSRATDADIIERFHRILSTGNRKFQP